MGTVNPIFYMRELRPRGGKFLYSHPGSHALPFTLHLSGGLFKTLQMSTSIVPLAGGCGHGPGLQPGEALPRTVDPLPPNKQSCESTEEEDTTHHCLPLVGVTVHLCKSLMKLESVHWGQMRGEEAGASAVAIPKTLDQLLVSGTSSFPLPVADAVHLANSY